MRLLAACFMTVFLADPLGAELPAIQLTPLPRDTQGLASARVDLNGTWKFRPDPPGGFFSLAPEAFAGWPKIEVPGEWAMQGFKVSDSAWLPGAQKQPYFTITRSVVGGYLRQFQLPAAWRGQRIKLHFDGVYSECSVWINSRLAGSHLGGFTPFELDVTDSVVFGRPNTLAVAVRSDSFADTAAKGMLYACHDLGGITRKVFLFAVPPIHVASLHIGTSFDRRYEDATVEASVILRNEGETEGGEIAGRIRIVKLGREGPAGEGKAAAEGGEHLFETQRTARKVSYWYGARSRQEIYYQDYFEGLAARHPNFRFHLALSEPLPDDQWTSHLGFIHEVVGREYLRQHTNLAAVEFYLCGPPGMINACNTMLAGLGVADRQIAFDEF